MIHFKNLPTKPPQSVDKEKIEKENKELAKKLAYYQQVMQAEGKYSMLVILQGMDAAGKDGAVKNVFKYCTHIDFHLHSFKKPSEEEMSHDFLWRVHKVTPAKGEIAVWNRSHYEDVLIQRVHGWIDEDLVQKRFNAINAFEDLLVFDNDTLVFKFFLNISYEEQEKQLQERLDEPEKNYKHNANDWKQRKYWDEYMKCYEDVLNKCNNIPWTVTPVDERWYRDYVILKTLTGFLSTLEMKYPQIEKD